MKDEAAVIDNSIAANDLILIRRRLTVELSSSGGRTRRSVGPAVQISGAGWT